MKSYEPQITLTSAQVSVLRRHLHRAGVSSDERSSIHSDDALDAEHVRALLLKVDDTTLQPHSADLRVLSNIFANLKVVGVIGGVWP